MYLFFYGEEIQMAIKRCLTIQDYSCMGRCSLTVALPILSTAGIETIGLPTAVLSNHTAFAEWTYTDLTKQLLPSAEMWEKYNHHFDCIYTGYLGNGQAKYVEKIIQRFKGENTMVVVDPAFADNGKLYSGFDENHVEEIRSLLKYADIICPNITETAFLLGVAYPGEDVDEISTQRMATSLAQYGPKRIIVTGVTNEDKEIGCSIFDRSKSKLEYYYTEPLPGIYHGAGDSFASAMVGCLLNDVSLYHSVKIAHDFVHKSMQQNIINNVDGLLYGLEFEGQLKYLYRQIQKYKQN